VAAPSPAKKSKRGQKEAEPVPVKEEVEEKITKDNIVSKLKEEANKTKNAVKVFRTDKHAPGNLTVYKDYDCTLNQTNIGQNNNKFYINQLLGSTSGFYL
jgi:poly [ADP-ribose] polymerase